MGQRDDDFERNREAMQRENEYGRDWRAEERAGRRFRGGDDDDRRPDQQANDYEPWGYGQRPQNEDQPDWRRRFEDSDRDEMRRGMGLEYEEDRGRQGDTGQGDRGRGFGYGGQDMQRSSFGMQQPQTPQQVQTEVWRRSGPHSGRGPKGYKRNDDRIREEACDRLTAAGEVDASEIDVAVKDGEITLSGTVKTRQERRAAEDCVEDVPGARHVQNNLRVADANTETLAPAQPQSGKAQTSKRRPN